MLLFCSYNFSWAQESKDEKHTEHDTHDDHAGGHSHISFFAGYTVDYHDKKGYKLGLEYEYRISQHWGAGATFDFTGADFHIFAFSLGACFYPFKKVPIVLVAGAGAKYKHEAWKAFYRAMIAYDFHFGKFAISPTIIHDFFPESKDITSYGVQFGIAF